MTDEIVELKREIEELKTEIKVLKRIVTDQRKDIRNVMEEMKL